MGLILGLDHRRKWLFKFRREFDHGRREWTAAWSPHWQETSGKRDEEQLKEAHDSMMEFNNRWRQQALEKEDGSICESPFMGLSATLIFRKAHMGMYERTFHLQEPSSHLFRGALIWYYFKTPRTRQQSGGKYCGVDQSHESSMIAWSSVGWSAFIYCLICVLPAGPVKMQPLYLIYEDQNWQL